MENADTLESAGRLFPLLYELGAIDEAEPLCLEALAVSRRVLGPAHETTFAFEEDQAGILIQRRRFEDAEALLHDLLERRRRLGVPDDIGIFTSLSNLAGAYFERGRLIEAEALLREAFEGTTRLRGPRHLDTFQARNGLAVILRQLNRLDEAQALYEETLDDALDQLALGHPMTIDTLNNLSHVHYSAGRFDQAEAYLRTALDLASEAHGPDHLLVGTSLIGLTKIAYESRRDAEFDALTRRTLDLYRRYSDAEPAEFLKVTTSRAWFLSVHGQPREAEELLCAAIESMDRELPELDSKGWEARYYLVQFLVERERFAEAEPQLLQCHRDYCRRRGVDARVLGRMIDFYDRWGHPELAEPYRDELGALRESQPDN
jgi:tetratricopeptide (TPR) repeat protein